MHLITRPPRTSRSPHAHGAHRRRRLARAATVVGAAGVLVVLPSGAASAHVRVHPDSTASGSYAQLTFRVPNESATAGTVKVVVTLPQHHPLTSVSTTPVPGWTVSVSTAALPAPVDVGGATITKAPRTVTWTAREGVEIGPGEYQDFPISVGPLPPPGERVLPATQTYSDGTVVRWADETPSDGVEPEHPAPSFTVTPAAAHAGTAAAGTASADPSGATTSDGPVTDRTARWLSIASLCVGALALAGVATLLVRQNRTSLGTPRSS
jgi:uncharacterized protein YcnI